jgi:hypothetical protein
MGRKSSNMVSKAMINAVTSIKDTKLYNGHWINEDTMTQLLQVDDTSTELPITSSCLRSTFSVRSKYKYVNDLTTANPLYIYKREKRKTIICYFYFSLDSNSIPPENPDWYSRSVHDLSCFTIQCSCRLNTHLESLDQQIETQNKRHDKTNRISSVSTPTEAMTNTVTHIGQTNNETQQETQQVSVSEKSNLLSEQIKQCNKWDSPEALSLFVTGTRRGIKQRDSRNKQDSPANHNVKNHVRMQIQLLVDAHLSPGGWKCVIDNEDKANLCTSDDIYILRLKSKYLATTLHLALQCYEYTNNFLAIVQKAIFQN